MLTTLSKFKNKYFDFGLIDSHFRIECIKNSLNKIKSDGSLIIDNSDAIDGINIYLENCQHKTFVHGISETKILFIK